MNWDLLRNIFNFYHGKSLAGGLKHDVFSALTWENDPI